MGRSVRSMGGIRGRCYNTSRMARADLSGPNAAYVAQLFAEYLDAPASVPDEWRKTAPASALIAPAR